MQKCSMSVSQKTTERGHKMNWAEQRERELLAKGKENWDEDDCIAAAYIEQARAENEEDIHDWNDNIDEQDRAFYDCYDKLFSEDSEREDDGEEYVDPEHGRIVDMRYDMYHNVTVYEDGYEERYNIGD